MSAPEHPPQKFVQRQAGRSRYGRRMRRQGVCRNTEQLGAFAVRPDKKNTGEVADGAAHAHRERARDSYRQHHEVGSSPQFGDGEREPEKERLKYHEMIDEAEGYSPHGKSFLVPDNFAVNGIEHYAQIYKSESRPY